MAYKTTEKYFYLFTAVVVSLTSQMNLPVSACGPFFPQDYFSYSNHPDLPLKIFAGGRLGILQPTLAESYLVVAYRYLTNNPLSPQAQKAVMDLWHRRLAYDVDINAKVFAPWLSIRNTVPGCKKLQAYDLSIQRLIYNPSIQPNQFPVCGADAFTHAAETLKELITRYGINSSTVNAWVNNQDKVFQNCNWFDKDIVILPEKPKNLDAYTNSLYIYQIASAYFYAGRFNEAIKYFEQIAADNTSPLNTLAKYLILRTKVQALLLSTKTPDDKSVQQMERHLSTAINDPSLANIKTDIQQLAKTLDYVFHPQKCFQVLGTSLVKDNSSKLYKDLDDYTTLLYKLTNTDNSSPQSSAAALKLHCKDDLTNWLLSFTNLKSNKEYILQKWHEVKTLPWLIAALAVSKKEDPDTVSLITAANNLSPNSPGYLTAQYYSIKLLTQGDNKPNNKSDRATAKTKLDHLLKTAANNMTPSAYNILLAERQKLSDNFDEYIHFALKKPVAEIVDPSYRTLPDDYEQIEQKTNFTNKLTATFDDRMVNALNVQLPFCLWQKLTNSKESPAPLRAEIISATWVRAILLNNTNVAKSLVPALANCYPSIRSLLQSYKAAKSPVEDKFNASYILLQAPGLGPYIRAGAGRDEKNILACSLYADNFWVPLDPKAQITNNQNDDSEDKAIISADISPYLSQDEKNQALAEAKILYTISPARFVYDATIAWMKINPNDPRIPNALYRIVKLPRWTNHAIEGSSKYSENAYKFLKGKYPHNQWAKQTKYWY